MFIGIVRGSCEWYRAGAGLGYWLERTGEASVESEVVLFVKDFVSSSCKSGYLIFCVQKAMQAIRKAMSKSCGVSLHIDELGTPSAHSISKIVPTPTRALTEGQIMKQSMLFQEKSLLSPCRVYHICFSVLFPGESKTRLWTKPQQSLVTKVPKLCTKTSRRNRRGSPVRIRA